MKIRLGLLLFPMALALCFAQEPDITSELYETYDTYRETLLGKRRIKHHDLQPLIAAYRKDARFTVKTVGRSIEGRDLNLISIGQGGNESLSMVSNAWK